MSVIDLKTLNDALLGFLIEGPERGGFITQTGEIVELTNIADDPNEGFYPDIDLVALSHLDTAIATWHSHPGASANLSVEDWHTFVNYPDLSHAIIGTDGVRWYRVENGVVVNA